MGIKYLNTYIKNNTTKNSINKITLSSLYGKTIAIDTSIYLYRFLGEDALLENMYIMLTLFRYYNIIPIFILDGKPPIEKLELIKQRCNNKNNAEKQYNDIKETLKSTESLISKNELYRKMQILKKNFIRLKRKDYINVLELMDAFGVTYIEATGEADILCAKLVIKKIAYACLSEDMDLFVYGCPRVLRYLSLSKKTAILYDLNNILYDLNLSLKEFKEICVISGTDYNINNSNNINNINNSNNSNNINNSNNSNNINNLYKILKYFELYKSSKYYDNIDFYSWLDNNFNFIENIYILYDTYNLFSTSNIELKKIKVKMKEVNFDKVKEIMKLEGFIFL